MNTTAPAASAFAVKVAGSAAGLASGSTAVISGKTVTLTLASAVSSAQSVTVSYTKPDSGNKLEDGFGNEVETFTDRPVTNN